MKFAPLLLSLACLAGGIACLALGYEPTGAGLIGAFLGQFAPSAHASFAGASDAE